MNLLKILTRQLKTVSEKKPSFLLMICKVKLMVLIPVRSSPSHPDPFRFFVFVTYESLRWRLFIFCHEWILPGCSRVIRRCFIWRWLWPSFGESISLWCSSFLLYVFLTIDHLKNWISACFLLGIPSSDTYLFTSFCSLSYLGHQESTVEWIPLPGSSTEDDDNSLNSTRIGDDLKSQSAYDAPRCMYTRILFLNRLFF